MCNTGDYYRLLGIDILPDGDGLGKYTDAGRVVPGGRIDRHWGKIKVNEEDYLDEEFKLKDPFLFDPELFRQHFGLRSVEFGNWVNQQERADFLYACGVSFMHLAYVLGISEKQIGFNGRLSLAIGARNEIPSATAHYERFDHAVINLTKTKGKGSLAHEWGHALDNLICVDSGVNVHYLTTHIVKTDPGKRITIASMMNEVLSTVVDKKMLMYSRGDYLGSPREIWARVFEHAISLLLVSKAITNHFLAEDLSAYEARPHYPSSKNLQKALPKMVALIQRVFNSPKLVTLDPGQSKPPVPAGPPSRAAQLQMELEELEKNGPARVAFQNAYSAFKRKLENFVRNNGGWVDNYYVARTWLSKIELKAMKDEAFRDLVMTWFKKGGTLLLRDQILYQIGWNHGAHTNLVEFNAFLLMDTVSAQK